MKIFFIKNHLWFIVFLGLGLFGYLLRAVNYFSEIPGDLGDARFNSVILEHAFKWLIGYDQNLWSPAFFYPFEGVLAFSDNHFGSSIFYSLFRLMGFSRETAFDNWFIIGNFLSFLASFYGLRQLNFSKFSSAAGAFVFAFGVPVLAKEGHAQLIYRFAIPFSFFLFIKFIKTNRLDLLSWVAFWVMIQFYCSIYLGIFLSYLLLAVFIANLMLNPSFNTNLSSILIDPVNGKKKSLIVLSSSLTLCYTIAVAWLLYQYYIVSIDYGFKRSPVELSWMLPRLASYLIADRVAVSSWIGQWITEIPMRNEHQMFFGLGVWVLVTCGLMAIWKGHAQASLGRISLLAFVILFIVTLNVNGYSFYFLLAKLPGISAIRAVSRIILVMLMPISILVAIGTEYVFKLTNNKSRLHLLAFFLLIISLLSVEVIAYQPYKTPISTWVSRQEILKAMLPSSLNKNSILFVTTKEAEPYLFAELDGMVLAQDLGISTLNGYSGNNPPGYLEPLPCYSYQNRFIAYASHRRIEIPSIQKGDAKIIIISPTPCDFEPVIAFAGSISAEQAKGLTLKINGIKILDKKIEIKILAQNTSLGRFNTVSMAGQPVRMSWRFVQLSSSGERLSEPGWDTRKDLLWSIDPNDIKEAVILTDLPEKPGSYLVEVSLVQEGVAWFQQLGMSIPSYQIMVNGI